MMVNIPSRAYIEPMVEALEKLYQKEFGVSLKNGKGYFEPFWYNTVKGDVEFGYKHRFFDKGFYHNSKILMDGRKKVWTLRVEASPEYHVSLDPAEMTGFIGHLDRIKDEGLEGFKIDLKKPTKGSKAETKDYEVMIEKSISIPINVLYDVNGDNLGNDPDRILWALASCSTKARLETSPPSAHAPGDLQQLWGVGGYNTDMLIQYREGKTAGTGASDQNPHKMVTAFTDIQAGLEFRGGYDPNMPKRISMDCPWQSRYQDGVDGKLETSGVVLMFSGALEHALIDRKICEMCSFELTCMSSNYSNPARTMEIVTSQLC